MKTASTNRSLNRAWRIASKRNFYYKGSRAGYCHVVVCEPDDGTLLRNELPFEEAKEISAKMRAYDTMWLMGYSMEEAGCAIAGLSKVYTYRKVYDLLEDYISTH